MPEPSADEIRIIAFDRGHAPQVVEMFKTVYGDEYPIKTYYHPDSLAQAIESKDLFQSLAVTADDRVVGVGNMYRSVPHQRTYEVGAGLVHPDFRRHNLFARLYEYLYETVAPQEAVDLLFGEDVCNHVYTQKMQAAMNFTPVALEVDLMPADTYSKEQAATGRVAGLLDCRTYIPGPHRVYLPRLYRDQLTYLYEDLDDARQADVSDQSPPSTAASDLDARHFEHAGVTRITVQEIGPDFASRLEQAEAEANQAVVVQIWLPIACPWVGRAVTALRERGYFLGGILPRWFGHDGLLMQKINAEPNWDGINLHLDRAKRILDLVYDSWRQSSRG